MGKQSKKGQARVNQHAHHKAGEGTHHHHKHHEGPLYKAYHEKHTQHPPDLHELLDDDQQLDDILSPPEPTSSEAVGMEDTDEDDDLLQQLLDEFDVEVPPEVLNATTSRNLQDGLARVESSDDADDKTPIYLADLDEILEPAPQVEPIQKPRENSGSTKNMMKTYSNGTPLQHQQEQLQQQQLQQKLSNITSNSKTESKISRNSSQRNKRVPVEPFNLSSSNTFRLSHLAEPEMGKFQKSSVKPTSNLNLSHQESKTSPLQLNSIDQGNQKFKARPLPKTTREPDTVLKDIPPVEIQSTSSSLSRAKARYTTPPKLSTAARSKDREERAKYFREVAERTNKERDMKIKEQKRVKRAENLTKSIRTSRINVPDKPFDLESTRRYERTQQKIEEMRLQQENDAKLATASFRARGFKVKESSPPKPTQKASQEHRSTVVHPFTLRSAALHDESVARQARSKQFVKEQEEAKPKPQFKSRPVPPTTYQPKPISTHELDTEWSRLYQKSRKEKLEELNRMEEENMSIGGSSFKSRPVPKTTYNENPALVSARLDESLRRVKKLREQKLAKVKEQEEEKKREEEARGRNFQSRPVPPTTYRSPTKASYRSRVVTPRRTDDSGEKNMRQQEDEEQYLFRALPIPKTTYEPSPVSIRDIHLVEELQACHSLDHVDAENLEQYEFHALPVPRTTYHPETISPSKKKRHTSSHKDDSSVRAAKAISNRNKVEHAVSTEAYLSPPVRVYSRHNGGHHSASNSVSSTTQKRRTDSKGFHARPLPKSTYEPTWVSPKVSSKKPTVHSSAPRQVAREKEDGDSTFKARPAPKSIKSDVAPRETLTSKSRKAQAVARQRNGPWKAGGSASVKSDASSGSFKAKAAPKSTYSFRPVSPKSQYATTSKSFTERMAGAALRRKARTLNEQKPAVSKNVSSKTAPKSKLTFTPVTPCRPSVVSKVSESTATTSPRKLPSPRKLAASPEKGSQTTFSPPDNTKNSYAPSLQSAFSQESAGNSSSGIVASSLVVGSMDMVDTKSEFDEFDNDQKLVDMLDQEPSAEITFGGGVEEDSHACELAAILDEGLTGEITAEISFNPAGDDDNDDYSENDQELAAILGHPTENNKQLDQQEDEHDAELAAILDF